MPICVLPTSTVSSFLRNMTWRNRAKVAPRCHPNCKSKVVLESICESTHAIKECLKNEEAFEKYFQDEEFETSTWPCEKCLEAFKNIKMFWRIILEKIFRINLPTEDECKSAYYTSVQNIAKTFQDEIVEQAIYVKNSMPARNNHFKDDYTRSHGKIDKPISSIRFKIYNNDIEILTPIESKPNIIIKEDKCVATGGSYIVLNKKSCKKINQSVSVNIKTVDCGETCDLENSDLVAYRNNVDYLQKRLEMQNIELSRLTKENVSMRLELQQIYRTHNWDKAYNARPALQNPIEDIPEPFESCDESLPMSTDSEMIITLKNCKNQNYKNISLLQVIHKSNEPSVKRSLKEQYCNKQEDPIELLNKVQETFGSIVKREISIVTERPERKKTSLINATYFNVTSSKSAPSRTTMSVHSVSSASVFVSTTE
ncbi:unnamed protein product [Colias eurytheme]|nr:unnamed protein product [Colias eurytheme]